MSSRPNLIGLSKRQLKNQLCDFGLAETNNIDCRVDQIWHQIYRFGVASFSEMVGINSEFVQSLSKHFQIVWPKIVEEQLSKDGTHKWLLQFQSPQDAAPVEVETVFIPETNRGTVCVSSQVGCSLACTFCHTGTQKMVRNLSESEILSQIMLARKRLGDFDVARKNQLNNLASEERKQVTNVVMMGMGEPLFNFENVKRALLIAMDDAGLCFSRRRVTLSTSGVVPKIYQTAKSIRCMLAISLHATRDELRDVLVPINRKYALAELMDACRNYISISGARRIVFEYVMLKGVNDSERDAIELLALLKGIPAKVNLIPFNPWPGAEYACSEWSTIESFSKYLVQRGLTAPIRRPRGRDILAACGQLKSDSQRVLLKR